MLGLADVDPWGNVFPELAAELSTIENGSHEMLLKHYNEFGKKRIENKNSFVSRFAVVQVAKGGC